MKKKLIPRKHQPIMVRHIVNNPRCAVWAGMGLGKTSSTLLAIKLVSLVEYVFPVLIVAPLRVAEETWPDEIAKWEDFKDLRIQPIATTGGSAAHRRAALRDINTPYAADIYTINYENLPWLIKHLGDNWPFKWVVSDESTKLKSLRISEQISKHGKKFLRGSSKKGVRALSLAKVSHTKVDRFTELTGTPSPNGLKDLWGQMWFLDAGRRLSRNYSAFEQRWFKKSFDGFSIEPLPHAQEEIESRLGDICLSLNAADYFDLKKPIENTIRVKLPKAARAFYDDMEKEMYMKIEEHEVEAFNAASRTIKCLQLANGAAYIGESNTEWKEIHDAKLKALEDIVEEAAGMPVLVAYNFKSDKARLLKHFKGAVDLGTPQGMAKFKKGKAQIGIGHPASIGHGVDGLQYVTNIMAIFGHDWNLELYLQFIERIGPTRQAQAGFDRPVFIHYIVAENTVDELVMLRRKSKREVQDILLEAMKHKKESV